MMTLYISFSLLTTRGCFGIVLSRAWAGGSSEHKSWLADAGDQLVDVPTIRVALTEA